MWLQLGRVLLARAVRAVPDRRRRQREMHLAPSRRPDLARAEPLSPRRKWWAILLATLLLVPGYWSLLAGLVSVATDRENSPNSGPFIFSGSP
jgi:hypothetical protein